MIWQAGWITKIRFDCFIANAHVQYIKLNFLGFFFLVYNQWMGEHGGVIINIVADFWKGFPGMRLDKINTNFKKI